MSPPDESGAEARRWTKVQEIFHGAVDLGAAERAAYLAEKCRGDTSLRIDVESLLAQDTGSAAFLEKGLPSIANAIFDGEEQSGEAPSESPFLQSFFNAFGPYRFQRELGRGGMGVVYLAEREGLGGLVAIKVLRDAWVSPARRERFANEQRTLAQLNHDAIARLFDANTLPDGTPWFAMEYVEGVPLTAWCKARAPTLRDRLLKFREVCLAVQYAHGQAVIHRDLKPSNIFVASSGTIKLLDFGIAKQLESIENPADPTQTAARLLTPAYAAPEQIRGENVGVQADVYALGVVLYELLTGKLPFDVAAHAPGNWEKELLESEPEPPSAVARRHRAVSAGTASAFRRRHAFPGDAVSPGAPLAGTASALAPPSQVVSASRAEWADLDVLCLRAMQKLIERRYSTVEAMVRDVDHFLAGEPLEARADSLAYRWGKFLHRHRRVVGAGVGLALIAVTFLIVAGTRLRAARDQALTEALKAQRVQRFTLQLFGGGEEELGPAESLRVATLIDRGVRDAGVLHHEPEVQAELFATLGAISREMGNFNRSDSLLSRSLEIRRTLFEPESPEVSESLVSLGLLRLDEARFDEAKALIGEAVRAGERGLAANHPALAKAHLALAQLLVETGEYDAAIAEAEESIRRLGKGRSEATTELNAATKQLSAAHFYAGRYEIADSLNQVVLDFERRIHGERHPRVAETLMNLGASQFDRGHYPEAEDFHRRGLEIIEEYYGPDHPETAYALTMLGRALVFEEKFDAAVEVLQRALVIRERVFGQSHPQVASTLNELSSVALQEGRLQDAEAGFRRMVEIYRKAYGEKHYLMGIALSNLASVLGRRGNFHDAEVIYRDVLRRYEGEIPDDHVNVGITRIKLGRALLGQKRYQETLKETGAGYEILTKQADPAVSFLRAAREDLAAAHEALGQLPEARRFREELEAVRKEGEKSAAE